MSDRKDRLLEVYEHLRNNRGVHTKKDMAEAVGITLPALYSAFGGSDLYLTDNLFRKICYAFPDTFNLDYLLTGEGELLMGQGSAKSPDESGELEALKSRIQVLEEQVSRQRQLIDQYESFVDLLTRQNRQLQSGNPFVSDTTPASAYDSTPRGKNKK